MKRYVTHLIGAVRYSFAGFRAAWRSEIAFRMEIVLAVLLTPLAFYLAPDLLGLALMLGGLALVLLVELINTAIEAAIDRIGEEIHPLSKRAKDCGSAAVLMACGIAMLIWLGVLLNERI